MSAPASMVPGNISPKQENSKLAVMMWLPHSLRADSA